MRTQSSREGESTFQVYPATEPDELIVRFGSPLYVYDADAIRAAFDQFRRAFFWKPAEFHYAIVCNKNRLVVRILHDAGAGIHANTPGDAFAALQAGVPAAKIVYSGTNLSRDDMVFLVERSIAMNLDSLDQLHLAASLGVRKIGLRLLIDAPGRPNRIGVAPDELPMALEIAEESGVQITGLHMYAGTNTLRIDRFISCFDRLVTASAALPDLEYLDAGGGFGVSYRDDRGALDLESLGDALSSRMAELSVSRGRKIALFIEPGRCLVAHSGKLYVTVISVKERHGRRYIGVDSTVGNMAAESVYHTHHAIVPLHPRGPALPTPTDVCGNTTHSRDYLARNIRLPEVIPGDLLALCDVGAYAYAMSSHFLNRPRPAEIVLDEGKAILTTRRETFDDLLATQVIA